MKPELKINERSVYSINIQKTFNTFRVFEQLITYPIHILTMEEIEQEEKNNKVIQKEVLKPITKVKSEEEKELQDQEVESTGGGMGAGGG
jgi:hypothetical protein